MDERLKHFGIGAAVGLAFAYVYASTTPSHAPSTTEEKKIIPRKLEKSLVEKVVLEFLESQSERNLEKMCSLVDDEIVYINEPHPIERAIRGKKMFREVGWLKILKFIFLKKKNNNNILFSFLSY